MSELNEGVNVTVDDATVITVPLVTTFTATNAAPTAKAVGDALAEKVDTDSIMQNVRITWNGVESDNQGVILADADDLPVEDGGDSVKDVLDAHGESIDELSGTIGNAVLMTAQTLTDAEKAQARDNIGAASADDTVRITVVNISNLAGLPQTITDARITADMVVVQSVLSNPAAQLCDWVVTAANGSLTISKGGQNTGIGYGGTNITLILMRTGSATAQVSVIKTGLHTPLSGEYYRHTYTQADEDSIFADVVTVGRIMVYKIGTSIYIRLQDFAFGSTLTAGQTYTVATLPENARAIMVQDGQFISASGDYHGRISIASGNGNVNITPQGTNIPSGVTIGLQMPYFTIARDHNDLDLTGFEYVTATT